MKTTLSWILVLPFFLVLDGRAAGEEVRYGDVSGDGVVGTVDASLILRHDAYLLDCFPVDDDCDGFGPETFDTYTVRLRGGVPMDFVRIPAGSFVMGSTEPDWASPTREQPLHTVTIAQPFRLERIEVTDAQWRAVMFTTPPDPFECGDNCPAGYVSWDECQAFIAALNALGVGHFRLPSEAEWEYACRAGTTTRFYFGDGDCDPLECLPCSLDLHAWWCANSRYNVKENVTGEKQPNAFGLYDMLGGVAEWVQDVWHVNYNGAPTDGSAWVTGGLPTSRVVRGGDASDYARNLRCTSRQPFPQTDPSDTIGLRLVLELP